jgi:hypothetical protein
MALLPLLAAFLSEQALVPTPARVARFGDLMGLSYLTARQRRCRLLADCVVKVQNYRVMIFWLEDDPTDERQSV